MIARGLRLCLAVVAITGLLGGCVAIAIPVIAGGAIARQQIKNRDTVAPVAVQARGMVTIPANVQPSAGGQGPARLTALKALPPPSVPLGVKPVWAMPEFTSFALNRARSTAPGTPRRSVLLAEGSTLAVPKMADCGDHAAAVTIDLDPGKASFDPAGPGTAMPGLPESLALLRAAGVTIMWSSRLPVDAAQAVYARLRAERLDPNGTDRLLLQRKADERKQTRLRAAARAWCVIAMVGDERGDFDELYDYLRDPGYAIALEPLFGAGWFVGPSPIQLM